MSEKRFIIGRESDYREEWYAISCDIKDGDNFIFIGMPKESAKFVVEMLNELNDENEQLRKELYESEKHYLIETSDISDKPYLEEELSELKKKYGVIDDESD